METEAEIALELESVVCALCGESDALTLFRSIDQRYTSTPRTEFTLVQCRRCGLRYLNPRPTESSLSLFYPEVYYADRPARSAPKAGSWVRRFYPPRARRILREKLRRASRHLLPGERMLEVGPAAGEFLAAMSGRSFDVVAVERSETMGRRIREELRLTCYRPGELVPGTLPPFHLVALWNTFEHLSDPVGFLTWARSLLVPGGVLLFSAPNARALERTLFFSGDSCEDLPRHLYSFSPRTIRGLLEKTGFERIKIDHATRVATSELQDRIEAGLLPRASGRRLRKLLYHALILPGIWGWDRFSALWGRGHTMIVVATKPGEPTSGEAQD